MPTLQDTILNFFESRYNDPLPAVGSDESEWPIQLKITSPNPSSYTALFSLGLSARDLVRLSQKKLVCDSNCL